MKLLSSLNRYGLVIAIFLFVKPNCIFSQIDINNDAVIDFSIGVEGKQTMDEPSSYSVFLLRLKALNQNRVVVTNDYSLGSLIPYNDFSYSTKTVCVIAVRQNSLDDNKRYNKKWILTRADSIQHYPVLLKINGQNYYCGITLKVKIENEKPKCRILKYGFLRLSDGHAVLGSYLK